MFTGPCPPSLTLQHSYSFFQQQGYITNPHSVFQIIFHHIDKPVVLVQNPDTYFTVQALVPELSAHVGKP